MQKPINILIGDNHLLTRDCIVEYLKNQSNFNVAGYPLNSIPDKIKTEEIHVDVVVIRLCVNFSDGLPHSETGYSIIRKIRRLFPNVEIIVISSILDVDFLREMKRLEITTLSINIASTVFTETINRIVSNLIIENTGNKNIISRNIKDNGLSLSNFTQREIQIIKLMSQDLRYKEIAIQLKLSEFTIETYRKKLFQIFNVKSRTALVIAAARKHLI